MAKLINGKIRFNVKPQPFIEMSDKFYFLGQGYTKYSLSPIKNDFSSMACDGNVFTNNNNLPIAKDVINMNHNINGYTVFCGENMNIIDSVDPNVEYMISNPLSGGIVVVKHYRNTDRYELSTRFSANYYRASILGQSEKYIYVCCNNSYHLYVYSISKDTLAHTQVTYCETDTYSGSAHYHFHHNKVHEDKDVIIVGVTSRVNGKTSHYAPRFMVLNKITNSVTYFNVEEENELGVINTNANINYQIGRSSNGVNVKDVISTYFIGSRIKDGVTQSILFKVSYNLNTLEFSCKEFSKANGFDIEELNNRVVSWRSHCYLEFDNSGDVDTLNVIDGYVNPSMKTHHPTVNLMSNITTFKIDTFSNKVNKVNSCELTTNDYMKHVMRISDNTIAVITPSNIVYCTKDNTDKIYRLMNVEPMESPQFVMKDTDQNIWVLGQNGSVYKHDGPMARLNMYCRFEKEKYEYKDRQISTSVIVGIKDYTTGKLVRGNVTLRISNNCVFTGNDSNVINITTSDISEIKVPVMIKAPGTLTTQIDLNFDTEE